MSRMRDARALPCLTPPRMLCAAVVARRLARHLYHSTPLRATKQRHAGDKSAPDFRQRRLADWQAELRAVRGVSWELADRILLFAGRLPVYPLDRGSMRIAARHGWIDLTAEYDDWQAFFVHRDGEFDLREVALWNTLVARGFCGRQPDCDHCPLRTCLPERGPVSLEFDE